MLAVAFLAIAVTIINFWWKISIHAAGSGASIALVVILSIKMQASLPWFLVAVILSAGLVMTARLWLNTHGPKEVWSGFFLGFICSGLFLFLY
jgi:membrane-associated phospholipid phosphatase